MGCVYEWGDTISVTVLFDISLRILSSSSFRFLISCPNSACNKLGREIDGCLFSDAISVLMRYRSSFREFISLLMMEETAELVGNCDWDETGRVVAAGEG